MKPRALLGAHLYTQIVIPLLLASILIGIAASVVAVYALRNLTNQWVSQVAESTTSNLVDRIDQYAGQMRRAVSVAAENPRLQSALDEGAFAKIQAEMIPGSIALDYDNTMLLDTSGTVVASNDLSGIRTGTRPFSADVLVRANTSSVAFSAFTNVGSLYTLAAFKPVQSNRGVRYTLVVTRVVNDRFLAELAGSIGSAYAIYGPTKNLQAVHVSSRVPPQEHAALVGALSAEDSQAKLAVRSAEGSEPGAARLRVDNSSYQARAQLIRLTGGTTDAPGEPGGYVVGIVSQKVSDQAARTTINLIMLWSLVAVIALAVLGAWVARSVSAPLIELAEGARRIADGDFTTKVSVAGSNEVATLASSFNDMTESLQERSESLTKKVLELATLYEMSRALGSTLDMDELLGSVLDSALRIFDLGLGYVTLRERDTSDLFIRAARGADHDETTAIRSSMSEWVVREGRPLIFNPDPTAGADRIDVVTGAKAALCVPLVSAEGTIGSITIGSNDPAYRFSSDDVRLLSTIANHVTIAVGNIELFTSLQEAYLATVRSLAAAVDAKDTYTRGHSDRVAGYATLIAERMGIAHEQRTALEMAAYLHDIGKIGVKEEILLKPGTLSEDEMDQMRHHPLIGANILKPVAFPWAITPVVRHHHENYDGTGYPAGLTGEEIPLLARILTAADSYEAMTADRPYRAGRAAAEAIAEMRRCAGSQFDPRVVEVLAEIVEELERTGDGLLSESVDAVEPDEARAIFSAIVDGVFSSFRRLGGPRLASNVETEIDSFMREECMPFRLTRGRVNFVEDASPITAFEIEQMRLALAQMDLVMGRVSGHTLVEHFYADAHDGLSSRMRHLAGVLRFREPLR